MKQNIIITSFVIVLTLSSCSNDEPVKVQGEEGAIKHMTEKCQNNEGEFNLSGLSREKYNNFCSCYWKILVTEYPPDEQKYFEKHGKNSPKLEELQLKALKECDGPTPSKS